MSLVRLSCPSASQVPGGRAVDGYINNQDFNEPIITHNTLNYRQGQKVNSTWTKIY